MRIVPRNITPPEKPFKYKTEAVVTCTEDFAGGGLMFCKADGTWSTETCERFDRCDKGEHVPNGNADGKGVANGARRRVTCNPGFHGQSTSVCKALNGTLRWHPPLECTGCDNPNNNTRCPGGASDRLFPAIGFWQMPNGSRRQVVSCVATFQISGCSLFDAAIESHIKRSANVKGEFKSPDPGNVFSVGILRQNIEHCSRSPDVDAAYARQMDAYFKPLRNYSSVTFCTRMGWN